MFMFSMRIVSDSLSYCMIYTIKYKILNKNTDNDPVSSLVKGLLDRPLDNRYETLVF